MSKAEQNQDQDWDKLMDDWQQEEAPTLTASDDKVILKGTHLKALINKVKKDSFFAKVNVVFTLVMTFVVGIYMVCEIHLGLPSKFDYVLYYGMLILIVALGGSVVWFQRGSWRAQTKQTTDYAQLMLEQNMAALKIAKVTELFGYGLLCIFYGIVLWVFFPSLLAGTLIVGVSNVAKPLLGGLILLCVTITGIASVYAGKKQQRDLSKKAETLRAFIEDFE